MFYSKSREFISRPVTTIRNPDHTSITRSSIYVSILKVTSDVTAANEQGETVSLMFEAIVNNVPDKHKQPVEPETVRSLQRRCFCITTDSKHVSDSVV